MYGIIYKATNLINNKVYIGQTIRRLEERIYYHYYRAEHELEITHTHFINAIRKYGKENFQWEQIDQADSQEELNNKEIYWIQYYNSIENGYNIQNGGEQKNSDKFALACGATPFLAYRTNGQFLGEYINASAFCRKYNITRAISDVLNGKYNSCSGIIAIKKDEFTKEELQKRLKKAKNSYRPFVAIKLDTLESFGPFMSIKECKEKLDLKNNHIGEILKGQRKSQEGYSFKFID